MYRRIFLFIFLAIASFSLKAQSLPEDLANHIAQKITDTLQLSDAQKDLIYTVNLQLHYQKMNMRQNYNDSDSLSYYIQQVENTRDSLYSNILPPEVYTLYLEKKETLIKAN